MASPLRDSRDFLSGRVVGADLIVQFHFTWGVGGDRAQI